MNDFLPIIFPSVGPRRFGVFTRAGIPTAPITNWQTENYHVHAGGIPSADFGLVSTAAGGTTFINPAWAFRQDCTVRRVSVQVTGVGAGQAWKLKIFRWNSGSSVYDYVGEREFTPGGTGLRTVDITPIDVQMGDVPGLYFPVGPVVSTGNVKAKKSRFLAGDVVTSDAFTESGTGRNVLVDCLSYRPYLVVTGDSIMEGHHTASNWHSGLHDLNIVTVPGGTSTSELANQLRGLIGGGTVLQYQNLALGSTGIDWVASTGIVEALKVEPHTILIHSFVNDVSTSRTWAAVEADLDTIKAALTTETLLIDEILPWTAGTDLQAATIRTWNASLAAWCAANGATLIPCHDTMAQVRGSTGELDDLLVAYDYDGVHLTQAGIDALAAIWTAYFP